MASIVGTPVNVSQGGSYTPESGTDRVVAWAFTASDGSSSELLSVTIGGVSAALVKTTTNTETAIAYIVESDIPAGALTCTATFSGSTQQSPVGVCYTIESVNQSVPVSSQDSQVVASEPSISGTLAALSGDVGIAAVGVYANQNMASSTPTDWISDRLDGGFQQSYNICHREYSAETEDTVTFDWGTSRNAGAAFIAFSGSADALTIRKSSTFDVETELSGTVTDATLDGNAITVDSQDGTTVTLTDSDGSITTSGEYDLVLTDDSDPAEDETITVQVDVYGVVPSDNPWQKDGSALADLTDVQYRVVAGTDLNGTELFYTGTGATDASGNIPTFDVSDSAADVDDTVHIVGLTANGESIVATETVELI